MTALQLCLVLSTLVAASLARSTGAPTEACGTMTPQHFNPDPLSSGFYEAQDGNPYDVTCERMKWPNDDVVEVSISGLGVGDFGADLPFKGVLARVWDNAMNASIGTYLDETKGANSTCLGMSVTHDSSLDKLQKFFHFKVGAPVRGQNLECRVTLVQSFTTFFQDTLCLK